MNSYKTGLAGEIRFQNAWSDIRACLWILLIGVVMLSFGLCPFNQAWRFATEALAFVLVMSGYITIAIRKSKKMQKYYIRVDKAAKSGNIEV
jgi:hypothetical protein